MVIESDRAEQVRQRDSEGLGNVPETLLREVSVPVVECVEERKKRGGLIPPKVNELLVRPDSHLDLHTGIGAAESSGPENAQRIIANGRKIKYPRTSRRGAAVMEPWERRK
jgi:hypothetical protein